MTPTSEQLHAVSLYGTRHLMVDSLAGTGKTSTVVLFDEKRRNPMLYLVFTKANKLEAREKVTCDVENFNSFGLKVWGNSIGPTPVTDGLKMHKVLRNYIEGFRRPLQQPYWDAYHEIIDIVDMAKAIGYVPSGFDAEPLATLSDLERACDETPSPLSLEVAEEILTTSIKLSYQGNIDFNDQVYMPAMFGGAFPRYPDVVLDEAQDANPVNWRLVERLGPACLTCVGDPWQSIYAFRGARVGGMAEAKRAYNMAECALTISFRCPEQVVKAARWRAPALMWFKEGGHVARLNHLDPQDIPEQAVFLCRNNAPLFRLALNLLRSGRSVTVAGSEIGPRIIKIMRKLGDGDTKRAAVYGLIDEWASKHTSATSADIAECMRLFAEWGSDLDLALATADALFKKQGTIQLMTGHKSKGLEFPVVFMLDPFLTREDEQDLNLRYVMQTRSEQDLYEINSEDICLSP